MKKIFLNRGKYTCLIDDEDYNLVYKNGWYVHATGYVRKNIFKNGKWKTLTLSRVLNKTSDGLDTDHINGNILDNRKANLRSCTRSQNCMNKKIDSNNTSGYKGVSSARGGGKQKKYWVVDIKKDGARFKFGYYEDPLHGAEIYDQVAIQLFGEYARTNFL